MNEKINEQKIDRKALTSLAFLIGLALIDGLSSTEQSAVGNFIMLIGQTLCTNGSYTFNDDWQNSINKNTLNKASNIINREINKL